MAADLFTPDAPAPPTAEGRLRGLNLALDPRVRYRLDSVFPKVDGFGWKWAINAKYKLVANIEPVLRLALARNETVLYVAKGAQQVSFIEQYFMGVWAASMNQTVVVLTDVRLLLIRTDSAGVPKRMFWSIYHSQIESFRSSWTGGMKLRLRDGKKVKFKGVMKNDRRVMQGLFAEAVEAFRRLGFDPQATQSMETLCSYCLCRVPKGEHDCGRCGAAFWPAATVTLRSLAFPSWGNFCLGNTFLAATELGWGLISWFALGSWLMSAVHDRQPFQIAAALFMLACVHGADAALTYAIAKKGLHPRRQPNLYAAGAGTASAVAVSPA